MLCQPDRVAEGRPAAGECACAADPAWVHLACEQRGALQRPVQSPQFPQGKGEKQCRRACSCPRKQGSGASTGTTAARAGGRAWWHGRAAVPGRPPSA